MRAPRPTRRPARARRRSTRRRRSFFPTAITRPPSSTWSARATSIRAFPTPRSPYSRSASRRWRVAWAPSAPRAGRRRCIWRSRRCWAPARTSLPRARSTAVRTTCSTTRCRASASKPRSSIRATSTPGARPSGRTRAFSSARRWAIPAWTCSTFRGWRSWRTSMACRCSSTRRSPRPGSFARSSMAPISCSIPRPSSCRGTASSSAVCWSTPAASIGRGARRAASFRH